MRNGSTDVLRVDTLKIFETAIEYGTTLSILLSKIHVFFAV